MTALPESYAEARRRLAEPAVGKLHYSDGKSRAAELERTAQAIDRARKAGGLLSAPRAQILEVT